MLKSRTIAPYFLSSLLGLLLLCAMVRLGFEGKSPTFAERDFSEQSFVAEEEPESEALSNRAFSFGGSAVSGGSEPFFFLKSNRFSFRGLPLASGPVKALSRSCSFGLSCSFFRILPNAP